MNVPIYMRKCRPYIVKAIKPSTHCLLECTFALSVCNKASHLFTLGIKGLINCATIVLAFILETMISRFQMHMFPNPKLDIFSGLLLLGIYGVAGVNLFSKVFNEYHMLYVEVLGIIPSMLARLSGTRFRCFNLLDHLRSIRRETRFYFGLV